MRNSMPEKLLLRHNLLYVLFCAFLPYFLPALLATAIPIGAPILGFMLRVQMGFFMFVVECVSLQLLFPGFVARCWMPRPIRFSVRFRVTSIGVLL